MYKLNINRKINLLHFDEGQNKGCTNVITTYPLQYYSIIKYKHWIKQEDYEVKRHSPESP